jgi:raffinose/stachyose/melibiose transport system permease protein
VNVARSPIQSVAGHLILLFLAALALFPLALVALNSLKPHAEVVRNPLAPPTALSFANFRAAWDFGHFGTGFTNSFLLTGTSVLVVVGCASLAGYVLAGKKVPAWPAVMLYFLIAVTVPIQLFLFPLYFAFAMLHLLGNVVAVGVVIAAINMPLSVFLMRTFFLKVPNELEDAALVDGANTYHVLRDVLLPIVSPGLLTVGVIVGLIAWNEFLISSTFLQGEGHFTATLGYLSMNGTFSTNQGVMMAGAMILIAPVVLIFVSVQRYFVEGFVSGAVKG